MWKEISLQVDKKTLKRIEEVNNLSPNAKEQVTLVRELWLEILKQNKYIHSKINMIQATIIPQKTDVNFSFPKDYIGKKVHAIFYIDEEISQMPTTIASKKPSDFFGTLSAEEGEKMQLHATQVRNEWDRNI